MYFTAPNSPVLTDATIGTAPIRIFEYGGGSSTSTFPFTGSALITGSLGVTGSLSVIGSSSIDLVRITQTGAGNTFVVEDSTNPDSSPFVIDNAGKVGIGTTTPTASLDIKASSSAATDMAFRVRNSTNTIDIVSVNGDGIIYKPHASPNDDNPIEIFNSQMSDGRNKISLFTKGSFNLSSGIGISFQSDAAGTTKSSYTLNGASIFAGTSYKDNAGLSEFNVGTSNVTGYSFLRLKDNGGTNTNVYISRTGTIILNPDNANAQVRGLALFSGSLGANADRVIAVGNGTSPTTSNIDSFQFWSNDIIAGNAAPHFRTEAGNIVKLYTQPAVTSSQGIADALTNLGLLTGSSVIIATATSGPFGIANSSGSYTYYSTLSASMAAASSGQTIEVFADYSGSSLIPPVILKNGVNINGNGHTYIGSLNSGSSLFQTGDGTIVSCSIINYNITIAQTATGSCLLLGTNTSGIITLTGTVLKATGSLTSNCMGNWGGANSNFEIIDFVGFCSTSQPCISWGSSPSGKLRNAYASATTGSGYIGNVRVDNSIFTSVSGIGLYNSGGIVSDSIGTSAGSYGIQTIGGFLNNSKGYSSGGVGIYVLYSNAYNCFGYSTSTYGMQFDNEPCRGYNCFGYSTANNGIRMYRFGTGADVEIYNSTAISTAATAFYWEGFASNMTCISEHNNSGSHAAEGANNAIIANSTLNVKHTGSNCLFKSTPVTQKYTQCTFKTATTPVNANITQGMINTQDNQGNIII